MEIQGNIDEPTGNALTWHRVQIAGWALPTANIKNIRVSVYSSENDQEKINSITVDSGTQIRMDLADAFPSIPNAEMGGFNAIVPIGDIEGNYNLVFEAITQEERPIEIGRRAIINSRSVIFNPPKIYHIGLVTQCNLNCLMCPAHGPSSKFSSKGIKMDEVLLEAALSGLKYYSSHIKRIGLSDFGEPFLYSDIFQALDRIHQACPKAEISITTNGTLLSDHIIDQILNSSTTDICISLDAGTKQKYEKIRLGANFEQVIANIKKLVETRNQRGANLPRISTNFVLLRANIHELPDYVRIAINIGVDYIGTVNPFGFFDSDKNEALYEIPRAEGIFSRISRTLFPKEDYLEIVRDCAKLAIKAKIAFGVPNFIPGKSGLNCLFNGRCYAFIVPSGDVYPCCTLSAMGNEKGSSVEPMGNIRHESFQTIWESERYSKFREAFFKGELPHLACAKCSKYYNL